MKDIIYLNRYLIIFYNREQLGSTFISVNVMTVLH